jgi:hypothetical protein
MRFESEQGESRGGDERGIAAWHPSWRALKIVRHAVQQQVSASSKIPSHLAVRGWSASDSQRLNETCMAFFQEHMHAPKSSMLSSWAARADMMQPHRQWLWRATLISAKFVWGCAVSDFAICYTICSTDQSIKSASRMSKSACAHSMLMCVQQLPSIW